MAGAAAGHADTYPRQPVDVLHYHVDIEFDENFGYDATVRADVRLLAPELREIRFDLEGPTVQGVRDEAGPLSWTHDEGRLTVALGAALPREGIVSVSVHYTGRPDGRVLVARPNAHGQQVLFADNWPEGARRWLPTVDHPSDKAAVSFSVTAAERFDVVAPGQLVETRSLADQRRLTVWSEPVAIPTYCMVVGLAEFEVTRIGAARGVPLSLWLFPPDADAATRMFSRTALMLEYFADRLGPFPYAKLAQVQSTIRYLGMENASAIFYAETELQGPGVDEFPVAHEIAHQWWGNSVTPADWDDLWLSEGFATYFDALFYEHVDGPESLRKRMAEGKKKILELRDPGAVVDPAITDPQQKLTSIVYRKGAWVLHMLRHRIGDEAFFAGLREFYQSHAGGNATTADLRRVLEGHTSEPLEAFFDQWLRRSEVPELRVAWGWDTATRQAVVEVEQIQGGEPYEIPLEIAFHVGGEIERRTITLRRTRDEARVSLPARPTAIDVDPETWLLHVATVTRRPPRSARSSIDNEMSGR
jgi:aminopeptidase N